MASPIVFYTKCKPQGTDAWPVARDHKIAFIGYPPWKLATSEPKVASGYKDWLYDVSTTPDCASLISEQSQSYRKQVTQNANLVTEVVRGSYVIVPRPEAGVCHFGKVSNFDLVDTPEWGQQYLELRQNSGLDYSNGPSYIADLVQCWHIDRWRTVPFPLVPRWISYRLLSRNTAGVIHGVNGIALDPYARVEALLHETHRDSPQAMTTAALLTEWVSPSTFEHLVVDLLQLESCDGERWHHVGGSGDGGVDGLAVSPDGHVVAALQCKWHYGHDPVKLADDVLGKVCRQWPDAKVVVAVLISSRTEPPNMNTGAIYLGLQDVAKLVDKHRDSLPIARALGI